MAEKSLTLSKQKLAGTIGIAVDEARENPTLPAADIVNSIFARVHEEVEDAAAGPDPEVKKAAHDRLHAAAAQLADQGQSEQQPLVNALIGVGLAILSNGEDAAAFFASFLAGGPHNA